MEDADPTDDDAEEGASVWDEEGVGSLALDAELTEETASDALGEAELALALALDPIALDTAELSGTSLALRLALTLDSSADDALSVRPPLVLVVPIALVTDSPADDTDAPDSETSTAELEALGLSGFDD